MKEKFGPKKKLKLTVLGEEYIPNWNNYGGKAHSALFDVWVMIRNGLSHSNNFKRRNYNCFYWFVLHDIVRGMQFF